MEYNGKPQQEVVAIYSNGTLYRNISIFLVPHKWKTLGDNLI